MPGFYFAWNFFSTNHRLFSQRRNYKPFAAETIGNYISIKSWLWLDTSISGTNPNDTINLFKDIKLLNKIPLNIFHSVLTKHNYKFSLASCNSLVLLGLCICNWTVVAQPQQRGYQECMTLGEVMVSVFSDHDLWIQECWVSLSTDY